LNSFNISQTEVTSTAVSTGGQNTAKTDLESIFSSLGTNQESNKTSSVVNNSKPNDLTLEEKQR
jgi:hypothetical protein